MSSPSRRSAWTAFLALAAVVSLALTTGAGANHSAIERISAGQIGGNGAIVASFRRASQDGTRVFFSTSEQLVSADTDTADDIYERSGGATTLVSAGQINGNGNFLAYVTGLSADGTRVVFSTQEQLATTDTDASTDLYERSGGTTTQLTRGQINGNGAFNALSVGLSKDGTQVFFSTNEQLVSADTDLQQDIYKRAGGVTTLLTTGPTGGNGAFAAFFAGASDDGSHFFFRTSEQLVAGDSDSRLDIYDRSGATTTLVSAGQINGNGAFDAYLADVSGDGTRVSFFTSEQLVSADTDTRQDVYQRFGGATTLVSAGQINGNGAFDVVPVGASPDATRLFFITNEPLVSADTDAQQDIYQRFGGATTLVSAGQINGNGAFPANFYRVSTDGTRVIFATGEQLVSTDTDVQQDIYERAGGTTTQVSQGQINGNGATGAVFFGTSEDGTRVFFGTSEQLVSADTDSSQDIYERAGGRTTRVSFGQINGNGAFLALFGGVSADGSRVFFTTNEPLVSTDTDSVEDVYAAAAFPLATYPTPRRAASFSVTLVPAFRQTISSTQCSARGGTVRAHAAPFSLTSCDPPALPAGTAAFLGREAVGSASLLVTPGNVLTSANEADFQLATNLTDVRAGSITGADYNPAAGTDITLVVKLRISDLFNGAPATQSGTAADVDFSVPVVCAPTSTNLGSTCSVTTTANTVAPGAIGEGRQAVVSSFRVRLNDSGANGVRGDSDDRNFAQEGIFDP